jgi:hypothetical protein
MRPRRAAAGLVLTAAGMIASRLSGRREEAAPDAAAPPVDPVDPVDPTEATHSNEDVERARAELAEELARRSARADNPPE